MIYFEVGTISTKYLFTVHTTVKRQYQHSSLFRKVSSTEGMAKNGHCRCAAIVGGKFLYCFYAVCNGGVLRTFV